ncbi:hypothetical protein HPB47_023841 [Ixodes persulcatus]|uniref:Uncharacterized protein n=1 Tax=Ixodes persulcatus TaxID=34615 RepID=A0AC60Q8D2_IXOPE|nr:hypothetical protein HPB47_023841 [Ixodes persulcatus]
MPPRPTSRTNPKITMQVEETPSPADPREALLPRSPRNRPTPKAGCGTCGSSGPSAGQPTAHVLRKIVTGFGKGVSPPSALLNLYASRWADSQIFGAPCWKICTPLFRRPSFDGTSTT